MTETTDRPETEPEPAAPADKATPPAGAAGKTAPKLGEEPAAPQLGDEPEPDGDAEPGKDPAAEEPIDYDFGEAPEGHEPYREAVLGKYKEAVGKLRLPNDQAKQLLDEMLPALEQDVNEHLKARIEAATGEWQEELEKRHGEKLPDVIRLGNRALANYATPALRKFIAQSPLASNPDFIDMLAAVGERITNDRSVKATDHRPPSNLSAEEEAALEYERAAGK